jgi:hypothetical protein
MSVGAAIYAVAALATYSAEPFDRLAGESTQCVYAQHRYFLQELKAGVPIETAVDYLLRHGARYYIYSKDDEGVTLDVIKTLGYEALQPVTILTVATRPWNEESEVLGLVFGDNQELAQMGCRLL